jgi:hypothetical protein
MLNLFVCMFVAGQAVERVAGSYYNENLQTGSSRAGPRRNCLLRFVYHDKGLPRGSTLEA